MFICAIQGAGNAKSAAQKKMEQMKNEEYIIFVQNRLISMKNTNMKNASYSCKACRLRCRIHRRRIDSTAVEYKEINVLSSASGGTVCSSLLYTLHRRVLSFHAGNNLEQRTCRCHQEKHFKRSQKMT